MKEQLSKQIHS